MFRAHTGRGARSGAPRPPVQINTLVAQETADDLPAIYELLKTFPVMRWSLFFLISVGRGRALQEVSPEHAKEIMNWVLDLVPEAPFAVKTTEAPSYRRLALNRMRTCGKTAAEIRQVRFTKVSRFATATGSSSFPARATSILRVFYLCAAEMCGPTRWWTFTGSHHSFKRCTRRSNSGDGVESANSATSVVDRAHQPSRTRAMRWRAIRYVFTKGIRIRIPPALVNGLI